MPIRLVCLSVGSEGALWQTADWIWVPFGLVVGSVEGWVYRGGDRRREGAVLRVNVEHPIVTNGILCVRGGDTALPRLLWDYLFELLKRLEEASLEVAPATVASRCQQQHSFRSLPGDFDLQT